LTEDGNAKRPQMDIVRSLQTKLVMSVTTIDHDTKEFFEQADVDARYVNLESIDEMHEDRLAIGEDYDRVEEAEELVQSFNDKVVEMEEKVADKEKPKVLILLG